ncbi:phage tail protein [Burkholderia diffusa]|uniref:phage tail protein n=1 Tax=Burkholderia diffusa TaxID=488732 RepID=UPI00158DDA62|nr:phage tail protein [Burkholderia diffusa]
MLTSLLSLDQFAFNLTTAPYHELQRRRQWKHPKKSRIGVRDSRQYTGQGDDTITLHGMVAPEAVGSIASIKRLADMADTGDGYVLVDGTGVVYGVFVITGLDETQRYHTPEGVPKKIDFTLTLERVDDDALRVDQEPDAIADDEAGNDDAK